MMRMSAVVKVFLMNHESGEVAPRMAMAVIELDETAEAFLGAEIESVGFAPVHADETADTVPPEVSP